MAINKGPHYYRPRRNPRINRISRAQRLRRLREKEALLKLREEQQVIDKSLQNCHEDLINKNVGLTDSQTKSLKPSEESSLFCVSVVNSLPLTKTGILNLSKQNLKKPPIHDKCKNKSFGIPNNSKKPQIFRHAKEKALLGILSGRSVGESFQCMQKIENINTVPIKNVENLNLADENSNLPAYSPHTTVINSVPVTIIEILGSSKRSLKEFSTHGDCKNKSSSIANRYKPRSNPRSKKSKAQRLRRAKEIKLCGSQIAGNSFQDCSKEVQNADSVHNRSKEILNPSKENEKHSDFLQNATAIDCLPVIKTEIIDPPEEDNKLIFDDYSQSATTMGPMLVFKAENIDISREDQKFSLPNIKVKETHISNTINEISINYFMNNENNLKNSKDSLETCSKDYIFPAGNECQFLPHLPGSHKKSISSMKKKAGFNSTVLHNKMNKNKVCSNLSKSVCSCFKKVAKRKQLCENYLKLVPQDDANQLCSCKAKNNTLLESTIPDEKAMKEFCLEYPNFGKINYNMKTKLG